MAKGKKKGDKKKQDKQEKQEEEVPSQSTLSITDTASTSAAPSVSEEGLTGGQQGKSKKDKKKQLKQEEEVVSSLSTLSITDTASSSAAPSVPEEGLTVGGRKKGGKVSVSETIPVEVKIKESTPEATEPPADSKKKPDSDDEGGLGLGLGGGKKRRPKKKKDGGAAAAPADKPAQIAEQVVPTRPEPEKPTHPALAPSQPPAPWGKRPQSGQPTHLTGVPPVTPSYPPPPGYAQPPPGYPQAPPGYSGSVPSQPTPSSAPVQKFTEVGRTSGAPQSAGRGQPQWRAAPSLVADQPRQSTRQTTPESNVLCRFKIPSRIDGNSVPSEKILLLTNYLPMKINPKLKIYRYDVSFKPEIKKLIPKAYMTAKAKHFKNNLIAFDQMKNCYTISALPGVSETERFATQVEIQDNNKKTLEFEVSFKFTGLVSLERITQYMETGGTSLNPPMEAIQCIDVILRQGTLMSYVKAGRQFFKRPARPIDLSGGLEMWTGLFQSAIFTSKSFINIDVAHKGFPRNQPLVEAFTRDFEMDPSRPVEQQRRNVDMFNSFIKGLRVVAIIGGKDSAGCERREFICNELVGPADKETFLFSDPDTNRQERMTVAHFFERKKGVRLRYPSLNCVWVGPRNKTIYYPMEMLTVSYGQALNRQLNEKQLRNMVTQAATPPDDRKRKIEEVIKDINYVNNPEFKKFGLDISDKFYEVEAKVLRPPKLDVGFSASVMPRRGEWRSQTVLKPQNLVSWGIVAIEVAPHAGIDYGNIINMTIKEAREMGLTMGDPAMSQFNTRMQDLSSILSTAQKKGIRFMFVIVGTRGRDLYHRVKQVAEREVGILTQCVKEMTAQKRMNRQTIHNILLKVNTKLMGVNQALSKTSIPRCLLGADVMVVGADVTHPSPDQSHIPSIAAVTASIDPECYTYNIELSIQTPKKEMIVQFEDMMVDHLKVYRQRRNNLPKKIFVFRDGVSEGQFAQVMNSELQAVHNAYHRMTGNPAMKPEVLFVLVQKRHHTRLFLKNSPANVEPGTVVDKDIVHASELDFYLVSHQAIKGTARPTRYHAVCNDGNIRHDEVEQLTYYLCHLFSRCMRSVSYPTPTYYAHLACLRARSLTFGERFDNLELEKHPKRLRVMENILQLSRMFFV